MKLVTFKPGEEESWQVGLILQAVLYLWAIN